MIWFTALVRKMRIIRRLTPKEVQKTVYLMELRPASSQKTMRTVKRSMGMTSRWKKGRFI